MEKKVKALIISASVVTGLAMTAGLVALTVNSSVGQNGGNVSFCAKPIGQIPYQIEKTIKINKHEFTYFNVISDTDGSWILLDKTSYIINTDIQFGFRFKNDTLIDITSYCGSMEPKKMGGSSLYPGYANYNVDFGIKLRISDKVDDNNIKDGINIGVIMHWCQ